MRSISLLKLSMRESGGWNLVSGGFNLAMNRPADYVSITLQRRPHPITSWGLRATNSMNRIFPRNRPALVPRGNHPPQQGKTNKVVKLFIHCLFVLFNKVYFFLK